jgi:hypothetical protein
MAEMIENLSSDPRTSNPFHYGRKPVLDRVEEIGIESGRVGTAGYSGVVEANT